MHKAPFEPIMTHIMSSMSSEVILTLEASAHAGTLQAKNQNASLIYAYVCEMYLLIPAAWKHLVFSSVA